MITVYFDSCARLDTVKTLSVPATSCAHGKTANRRKNRTVNRKSPDSDSPRPKRNCQVNIAIYTSVQDIKNKVATRGSGCGVAGRNGDDLHVLEGLQQERAGTRFGTPLLDDDDTAADHLAGLAVGIELAQADPLAELLGVFDLAGEHANRHDRGIKMLEKTTM